jgi:hypothetical protein
MSTGFMGGGYGAGLGRMLPGSLLNVSAQYGLYLQQLQNTYWQGVSHKLLQADSCGAEALKPAPSEFAWLRNRVKEISWNG